MIINLDLSVTELLADLAPRIDERIATILPRQLSADYLGEILGETRYELDEASLTDVVARPIWYCLESGGKRWRPVLALVAGAALGADADALCDLAIMCELIHNGTLIADDIEDDSPLRRGRKAIHLEFGIDVAVNAGNMLYFLPTLAAMTKQMRLPDAMQLGVHRLVVEEMTRLHAGQAMDIAWHRGLRIPTVQQYLQMCAFKTGTLARMSVRTAAVLAETTSELAQALGRYAESIGVAFQIQDDILNVTESALSEAKGFGEDIHEGKITLLVIHALNHASEAERGTLLTILSEHTTDARRIREAVEILSSVGALDYGRDKARDLVQAAWEEVHPLLPENPAAEKLREFGEYLTTRDI